MNIPIELFEKYLRNKNLKETTIKEYLYYFMKFTFQVFNQETISEFLSEKANRNNVSRAFIINLKEFLRINNKQLNINPELLIDINNVQVPKITGRTKTRLVNPVQHEDILKVLSFLSDEQQKLQLLITYYCGLRSGEMCSIKINAFNWNEWKKDTNRYGECRVYGKGDKEGIAIVPPELMIRVARFIKSRNKNAPGEYLFSRSYDNNKPISSRTWRFHLRNAGIKAGLTQFGENSFPTHETTIHPHRLRHSWGTYLTNTKNMDIRSVQEILRHSSITSTQIYTHINKEDLKNKLSSYSSSDLSGIDGSSVSSPTESKEGTADLI